MPVCAGEGKGERVAAQPQLSASTIWVVVEAKNSDLHVVPHGDTAIHELSGECWCRPIWDECWAHNSADGRERACA